jgi:hypothetical protein
MLPKLRFKGAIPGEILLLPLLSSVRKFPSAFAAVGVYCLAIWRM